MSLCHSPPHFARCLVSSPAGLGVTVVVPKFAEPGLVPPVLPVAGRGGFWDLRLWDFHPLPSPPGMLLLPVKWGGGTLGLPRACSLASLVHVASKGRACSPPVLLLLHPPSPFPPTHGCLVGRGGLWVSPGARAHATASPPATLSSHPM